MFKQLRRNRSSTRGHQGFTLIELLVVVAIIALLIAILLPSLKRARDHAKQSACLSHIKNIATSSRVYEADDPSGWGIPVHPKQYYQCPGLAPGEMCNDPICIGAYEWGGKAGIGYRREHEGGGLGDMLEADFGSKKGFGPASRPMNDLLYKGGFRDACNGDSINCKRWDRAQAELDTQLELELFMCPADDGPPRGGHCPDWIAHTERSSYDHFGNSYAANVFMVAYQGGGEMNSNSPYMRPTSRVPTPSRTLYYEENIGRWAWSCRRELPECVAHGLPGVYCGPTGAIRGWHGRDWTFNRAFVDAHATQQKIYIEGTEDGDGYALHYRNEIAHPDDPQLQRVHECIVVRGDGWQKDTLPAALIPTGLWHSGEGRPSYEDCVD